jgi:GNAT superfamily N-acetyltransferase
MPETAIRPFRPTDGAALARLHRRAIMAIPEAFYPIAERESWAHGLTNEGYARAVAGGEIIEVAVDGGDTPIAFCGRKDGEVCGLYVDPDHQGNGIGRALLERAEAAIVRAGHRRIVVRASLFAVPFYRSKGYAEVGHTQFTSRGGLVISATNLEKIIV